MDEPRKARKEVRKERTAKEGKKGDISSHTQSHGPKHQNILTGGIVMICVWHGAPELYPLCHNINPSHIFAIEKKGGSNKCISMGRLEARRRVYVMNDSQARTHIRGVTCTMHLTPSPHFPPRRQTRTLFRISPLYSAHVTDMLPAQNTSLHNSTRLCAPHSTSWATFFATCWFSLFS